MTPTRAEQPIRDILSLMSGFAYRLAQAAVVTIGVFLAITLGFRNGCACSTKEKAYQAAMKSDLRNLVTAQETYFDTYGTHAPTVEALGDLYYTPSVGVSVLIEEASGDGWRGAATHDRASKRCAIFVGRVAPPSAAKDAIAGTPVCWEGKKR